MSNILKIAGAGVSAAEETDENFNQTVLLLHGDGTNGAQNNTFLDSSTNNFTITRNGNTTQGTFSPFSVAAGEWSNYFDGSGDFLSLPDNAALNFGSSDWTVEMWVYPLVSGPATALGLYVVESTTAQGLNIYFSTTNKLGIAISSTGTTPYAINVQSTASLNINAWNHIAVVRNGSGSNNITGYVNGSSEVQATFTGTIYGTSVNTRIGSRDGSSQFFNGYISNVRSLKNSAVYTAAFTPPTAPLTAITNTSLLTCQSNRFVDNSTNNFAITRNGDVKVTPFSPFAPTAAYSASVNGGSAYLDGTGDYLTGPTDTAFDVWGGDFTYECWIYPTAALSNNLLFVWGSTSGTYISLGFFNNLNLYSSVSASNPITGTVPTLFAWNHVSVSKESGTFALFLNGVRLGTSTSTSYPTGNIPFVLGASSTGTQPFPGYVAGNRLVKGTAVYDPTQTTITIPTAPLTAVSGTSLLLNFTNAGIFDNTGKNNLETVADAQIDTTTKKYGTGSMEFDGTGDYIDIPFNQDFVFGTGDFTVELWVYVNSTGRFPMVMLGKGADASPLAESTWALRTNTTDLMFTRYDDPTSTTFSVTWAAAATTWYHIAVTRSGTDLRFFVDGTQVGATQTSSTDFSAVNTTDPLRIGRFTYGGGTVDQLNGFIDDLRITKGVARYTSNFTPPTKAFADL